MTTASDWSFPISKSLLSLLNNWKPLFLNLHSFSGYATIGEHTMENRCYAVPCNTWILWLCTCNTLVYKRYTQSACITHCMAAVRITIEIHIQYNSMYNVHVSVMFTGVCLKQASVTVCIQLRYGQPIPHTSRLHIAYLSKYRISVTYRFLRLADTRLCKPRLTGSLYDYHMPLFSST